MKPTDHQREELRAELHNTIDTLIDNWPHIEHQARTMGGGYQADTLAGGSRSATTDPMLNRIQAMQNDLAQRSRRWTTQLQVLIHLTRQLQGQAAKLLPLNDDEVAEARARKNTTEACAGCPEPIVDGEIKRIDGKPYHKNSCYFREWRARRGATMQPA